MQVDDISMCADRELGKRITAAASVTIIKRSVAAGKRGAGNGDCTCFNIVTCHGNLQRIAGRNGIGKYVPVGAGQCCCTSDQILIIKSCAG